MNFINYFFLFRASIVVTIVYFTIYSESENKIINTIDNWILLEYIMAALSDRSE